jgi:hypothetical protein
MSVALNGIAHIQLTVNNPAQCLPFWEKLCHFFEMRTLIQNEDTLYCIGSRTGILVRGAPAGQHGVHSISCARDSIISACGRGAARTSMRLRASRRKLERRSSTLRKRAPSLLPDIIRCCSRIRTASALR